MATTEQKAIVLNAVKQLAAYAGAFNTAVQAAVTGLTGSSTADQLQAGVDALAVVRAAASSTYGGIALPTLSANDALSAVKAEADAA